MDSAAGATLNHSYEDFQPSANLVRKEAYDTLVVHLPGFKKEQVKVQIDNLGNLKISGQRLLEENRWIRFHKDFRIPKNCNVSAIYARFIDGLLYVALPKTITRIGLQDQPAATSTQEAPASKKIRSETKSEKSHDEQVTSRVDGKNDLNPTPQMENNQDNVPANDRTNESNKEDSRSVCEGKMNLSAENAAISGSGFEPEHYELEVGGLVLRLKKPRRAVVVNVAVAVVVALGVYIWTL